MIEVVPRSGPPEAMNCPAVICDACRRQVVGKGNIIWAIKVVRSDEETRQQSPVYAAHKGACDRGLEAWLKKQYGPGWITLWEEMGTYLRQLLHNAEHSFEEDAEGEYHRLVIKQPGNDPHIEIPDGSATH
ncbi:hypothetical protein [Streptomyces lateritius]|uniref:hypothetical protein n=1 Tax=Streptomyces lateritius TaxID=67313 RepID=UPI001C8B931E|nr:hypothetical protein [Streptomyces lateritius]MBX9425461.1 hypothetical protein [Streptomyces lateritius]